MLSDLSKFSARSVAMASDAAAASSSVSRGLSRPAGSASSSVVSFCSGSATAPLKWTPSRSSASCWVSLRPSSQAKSGEDVPLARSTRWALGTSVRVARQFPTVWGEPAPVTAARSLYVVHLPEGRAASTFLSLSHSERSPD